MCPCTLVLNKGSEHTGSYTNDIQSMSHFQLNNLLLYIKPVKTDGQYSLRAKSLWLTKYEKKKQILMTFAP